jgi:hypothetical protein
MAEPAGRCGPDPEPSLANPANDQNKIDADGSSVGDQIGSDEELSIQSRWDPRQADCSAKQPPHDSTGVDSGVGPSHRRGTGRPRRSGSLSEEVLEDGKRFSLRWILYNLIEECARHNGHADLPR